MAYPTTADLVAGSAVSELTGLTSAQQDAFRDAAIAALESYANQAFAPEGTSGSPVERLLDGNGGVVLRLPKRLSELVELAAFDLGAGDVELSERRDRLVIPQDKQIGTYYSRALRDFPDRPFEFPRDPASVRVSGVWGWADAEFPVVLESVLRVQMEDAALGAASQLEPVIRSSRDLGVRRITQGGLSVELSARSYVLSERARELLPRELIWGSNVGAAV